MMTARKLPGATVVAPPPLLLYGPATFVECNTVNAVDASITSPVNVITTAPVLTMDVICGAMTGRLVIVTDRSSINTGPVSVP